MRGTLTETRPVLAALVLAGASVCATLAAGEPAVQPPTGEGAAPTAIVILDGSGSMWGRLDGDKRAKVDLARDALRAALAGVAPSAKVGLASFGHRRSGDCSDIEVVAQPGPVERLAIPLEKLNPRGKGPISGALREAANALGSARNASIVLIHDNADNCRQDACEAASAIAEAHPNVKIHIVPLGLDAEEMQHSACIAKITGGRIFAVSDASGVAPAIGEAVRMALRDGQGSGGGATASAAVERPVGNAAPADGPSALLLVAKLGSTALPPSVPIRWRVVSTDSKVRVFDGAGNGLTIPLPPGGYAIDADTGFVTAHADATVGESGAATAPVSFNAGALHLPVSDLKDGAISNTAIVTLTGGADGKAQPLWIGPARDADFVLAPGSYRVRVVDGLIDRNEAVVVAAGDVIAKPLVLGAGHLELTSLARADGPALEDVTFLIAQDDPDAQQGRREIARSAAIRPVFTLAAGTYYVTARQGAAEVHQQVGIGAGDSVKQTLVLGLARLTVSTDVAGANGLATQTAGKSAISTRILSLTGDAREVARATGNTSEFALAGGRYRIETGIGTLNVKAVQDIDLEVGSNRRLAMKLDAGVVSLRFTGGVATNSNLSWDVRDAAGRLVIRTQALEPQLVLTPGRYRIGCDIDDKRVEKPVEIKSGTETRPIDFAMP